MSFDRKGKMRCGGCGEVKHILRSIGKGSGFETTCCKCKSKTVITVQANLAVDYSRGDGNGTLTVWNKNE